MNLQTKFPKQMRNQIVRNIYPPTSYKNQQLGDKIILYFDKKLWLLKEVLNQ
jgi:hypothetical protein